jgi:hypothetical protein
LFKFFKAFYFKISVFYYHTLAFAAFKFKQDYLNVYKNLSFLDFYMKLKILNLRQQLSLRYTNYLNSVCVFTINLIAKYKNSSGIVLFFQAFLKIFTSLSSELSDKIPKFRNKKGFCGKKIVYLIKGQRFFFYSF